MSAITTAQPMTPTSGRSATVAVAPLKRWLNWCCLCGRSGLCRQLCDDDASERALVRTCDRECRAEPGEHTTPPNPILMTERPDIPDSDNIPADIMLLHIGDLMLVTQPAEVFAETAIQLKIDLRALGIKSRRWSPTPMVSYSTYPNQAFFPRRRL